MSAEISVSKGVFVNKNGFKRSLARSKFKKKGRGMFSEYLWYQTYFSLWNKIEAQLHVINSEMFSSTLKDLIKFVHNSCNIKVDEVPAAALLTGINMPDHEAQFSTLIKEIKENVTPHCVYLPGVNCHTLKLLVENMVKGFIHDEDTEIDDSDDENDGPCDIKKSQCNFSVLQAWYESLYMNNSFLNYSGSGTPKKRKALPNCKPLLVIFPDLENCNESVIQDFILIAYSYINILPFVIIFGVATSLTTLHRILPFHVSSKTSIKVFRSQPSVAYLNNVLENVFFTEVSPFSLGGKVFNLFVEIFLYYDLSVTGFIKNYKFAMLEHFSQGNIYALCCNDNTENVLNKFSHEDFENLRKLYSFRELVEKEKSYRNRIFLLSDDDYLKKAVSAAISTIKEYKCTFHLFLKCLHVLVKDLPKTPLGKQVRELYAAATSKNIVNSIYFKECFQLLNFQVKAEFTSKLKIILQIFYNNIPNNGGMPDRLKCIYQKLNELLEEIESSSQLNIQITDENKQSYNATSRRQFKEDLIKMSQSHSISSYAKVREKTVSYLQSIFEEYLVDYRTFHFHEIFFFNDILIQNQLIGTQRSAIHNALKDPQNYLQCTCCEIQNEGVILPTMPDISIAYKLHLECGKMINLYDWLQAFLSILDWTDEDEDNAKKVDPELQARFTQAIVELEYLGFIKTSKKKTDHVQRLTWGG